MLPCKGFPNRFTVNLNNRSACRGAHMLPEPWALICGTRPSVVSASMWDSSMVRCSALA